MVPTFLRPERFPYASIEIVPVDAVDNTVTDALIEAERDECHTDDEDAGAACGVGCGFCGRCS